jgi:hypothetical protein
MNNEVKAIHTCENTEQNKIIEKYIYHFDYPHLTESGYVTTDLSNNNIIVLFPEKPNLSVLHEIKLYKNSLVYINKKLHFSFEWLPIYNYNDYYKVKDMLTKAYYDYMSDMNVPVPSVCKKYCPYYCSEVLTEHKTNYFEISCFENKTNTCFDILILTDDKLKLTCNKTKFKNFQIFIGGNLIFCGKRDLLNCNIPLNECQNIIQLMLLKLLQV